MSLVSALLFRNCLAYLLVGRKPGLYQFLMKKPMHSLRRAASLLLFLVAAIAANATNYYFSSQAGDDSRTGQQAQNPSTPWRSLTKLNAMFHLLAPGDTVFLKRGDVFYGTIQPSVSGSSSQPIVITAYGAGELPVVSGVQRVLNWKQKSGNIWEADTDIAGQLNILLVNGEPRAIGRYPNSSYLKVDQFNGNTSITDNALANGANWNGGEVVIRKNRWIIDRNKITNHSGSTISYNSESGYPAAANFGYFLQNHPAALDQEGEWYFQNGKIGLFTRGNPTSAAIEAGVVSNLVQIENQSNIQFSSIDFSGANGTAFKIQNASNISIVGCRIRNSGVNAVDASNAFGLSVQLTEVLHTNNVALNLINCNGTTIRQNKITNSGTIAGMGKGGDGTYSAILINGDNNTVEGNKIENTGYVPLSFNGSAVLIKNNFINRFTLVKDDGGGIYTWNNSAGAPNYTNRRIEGNIVLNGMVATAGTDDQSEKFSHGIYIDDNAANVEIVANTVANIEGSGLYIHNARDVSIKNNTAFNNTVQLSMIHDDIAPNSPIRNTDVRNNVLFSLQPDQAVAEYKSRRDDLAEFGSFDGNVYSRPADDNAYIGTLKNVAGNYTYQPVDVEGWSAMSGKDKSSKNSPKTFIPYRIDNVVSGNLFGNGAFNSNIGGLYAFSPANNCNVSWSNNGLDGGSLEVSFSSATNFSKGTVVIGVGTISAGKKYRLRFSVKGSNENKLLDVYLRKSGSPYNDVTKRNFISVKEKRKEVEVLFEPTESTSDGSIGIDVQEHSSVVYLDNIELREVTASNINLGDSVKFIYNATMATATTALPGNFTDVQNTAYAGSVSVAPFSSVVLLAGSGNAPPPPPPAGTCSATGTILREQWNDIDGNDVASLPLALLASSFAQIASFESAEHLGNQYGARIRGFVCPPTTGNYTFFIAGDDATELWLSTSENPAQKQKIAYNLSWTNFREWKKYPTQKSAQVYLEAGKKYYIEALHKEGAGGDHLSVGWLLPDGSRELPIPGNRLSPFQASALASQTISFPSLQSIVFGNTTLSLLATASSGLPVSFSVVSGPATISGNTLTPTAAGTVVIKASQSGSQQFAAAPDVTQTLEILPEQPASQCQAAGSILWEQWTNADGNNVWQLPLANDPATTKQLTFFEGPTDVADKYGSRIRGYICAPETGSYTFYIAGDDATELWLSTNDGEGNKRKIAYNLSWTGVREWNRFPSQKSTGIYLEAGKKYYIEALHKEGNGGDHLSVAWTLPSGKMEAPIAGSRLSPFVPVVSNLCSATGTILREEWKGIQGNDVSQIPQASMPHYISEVTSFESPSNAGNNFGERIRGFICPPQTGNYTFYIAGDDATELWLSSTDVPSGRKKIAYNLSWTGFREWNRFPSQKSAAVYLEAGKKYYIEALHKEGAGDDHLSVAWQLPDGTMEAPINGSRLSPIEVDVLTDKGGARTAASPLQESKPEVAQEDPVGVEVFPNPFSQRTRVQVTAPQTGSVKVTVCDLNGRVVKTVFNGLLKKGETKHLAIDGASLPAGVYVVRTVSGATVSSMRIVKLIR
ncbi:MAG TPA: PA14 domain-containing protein [Flavisolibacter sp.]|nr:PA14 domain-containing protein [Flavisolibacter sp.]